MLFYIITYDISDNKRRKKVSDLLEGYGRRVQYSVFECVLETAQYEELRRRLKPRVTAADSIRFYPLSRHTLQSVDVWGGLPITPPPGSIII